MAGYGSLVGPGSSFAGVDQGIDFVPAGSGGFDIYAPASGTITLADATGHHFNRTSGQALIMLQLDQAPANVPNSSGFIYFAEIIDIAPNIRVGVHVDKGAVIGHCNQSPGIEVGWGRDAQNGFLCEIGIPTPCGQSFNNWIQGLPGGGDGGVSGGSAGGGQQISTSFNDPVSSINDLTGYDPSMGPPNNRPIMLARNIGPSDLANTNLLTGSMKTTHPPHFMVYFMWNPTTVDYSYQFTTQTIPIDDLATDLQNQASMMLNQSIQLTLLFDRTYEVGLFQAGAPPPSLPHFGPNNLMWDNDPTKDSPFTKGVWWDIRAVERLLGIYDNMNPNNGPTWQAGAGTGTPAPGTLLQGASGSEAGVPMGNAVDIALGSMYAPIFRGYFTDLECQITRFSQSMIPTRCQIVVQVARLQIPDPQNINVDVGHNPYESTPVIY